MKFYQHNLIVALLLTMASTSYAAEQLPSIPEIKNYDNEAIRQKNNIRLDHADHAARSGQMAKVPQINTPSTGVDIGQIAHRYNDNQITKSEDNLLIFISLSMPKQALIKLAKQAQATQATLVLRGIEGGITNGRWPRAMESLKPITETGATVVIHPDYFKMYRVNQVPTFLLVSNTSLDNCDKAKTCELKLRASGDVSLDYVLGIWADSKTPLASIAKDKLSNLEEQ